MQLVQILIEYPDPTIKVSHLEWAKTDLLSPQKPDSVHSECYSTQALTSIVEGRQESMFYDFSGKTPQKNKKRTTWWDLGHDPGSTETWWVVFAVCMIHHQGQYVCLIMHSNYPNDLSTLIIQCCPRQHDAIDFSHCLKVVRLPWGSLRSYNF